MRRRILLVDDELAILLTLKAVLEMNGFEVETATSPAEARKKLDAGVFHMVITDMRMDSDTAGFEVIRAARSQPYDPATAILTAYPELGRNSRAEGADSLLVKPMNTGELLRQIEALLVTHQENKQGNHANRQSRIGVGADPGAPRSEEDSAATRPSLPKAG